MDLIDLLATAKQLLPYRSTIFFVSGQLSIAPENPVGVIINPPTWEYNGQWVYEITDQNQFETEIKDILNFN